MEDNQRNRRNHTLTMCKAYLVPHHVILTLLDSPWKALLTFPIAS